MKNWRKLKEANIFVNKYFSHDTLEHRRELWKEVKCLCQGENKIVYLNYSSIVVKSKSIENWTFCVVERKQCYLECELKLAPDTCLECLLFVPFSTEESFINNESDSDVNFYNDVFSRDTQEVGPYKFQINFKLFSKQSLSILHLNI